MSFYLWSDEDDGAALTPAEQRASERDPAWQGKRPEQVSFSAKVAAASIWAFLVLMGVASAGKAVVLAISGWLR
jgi:hypothetical protein